MLPRPSRCDREHGTLVLDTIIQLADSNSLIRYTSCLFELLWAFKAFSIAVKRTFSCNPIPFPVSFSEEATKQRVGTLFISEAGFYRKDLGNVSYGHTLKCMA